MLKQIHHNLAKTPLILRVVSLYVVALSVFGTYYYPAEPVQVASATVVPQQQTVTVQSQPESITGLPRRIELSRIGLTREVIDGEHNSVTQEWTLSDDKTHFAVMTSQINDRSGQTLIYGHNTAAVLEPVRDVQLGDELTVTTDNGRIFVYTYSEDRFVEPTDASVLFEQPSNPRVVLMTCEGWLSETRRLLYFDFKEVR